VNVASRAHWTEVDMEWRTAVTSVQAKSLEATVYNKHEIELKTLSEH
jgi:hypothetical protein